MWSFEDDVEEKPILDGVGFFWRWKLACGVCKEQYICRVLEPLYSKLIAENLAIHPMDINGKVMKEFVCIDAERVEDNEELVIFVMMWVTHANSAAASELDIE